MDEHQTAADQRDHSYLDKSSGRLVTFTPTPDEVMVRLRRSAVTGALAPSRGRNVDKGFAALFVDPLPGGHSPTGGPGARSVEAALPVMLDRFGEPRYFLPDELTVQFQAHVLADRAVQVIETMGSRVVAAQRTPGYYTVSVPDGGELFGGVRAFSALDEVQFAEPSEVGFGDALDGPDAAGLELLWALRNTGQAVNGTVGTPGADIRAVEAWQVTRGVPDVVVAVVDTGVDIGHQDLVDSVLPRGDEDWDFADSSDADPDDDAGHGTHVAGTVGAVGDHQGVAGVAPGCRVMPLRINLTAGTYQNRADAIDYVRTRATSEPTRRYVVNCSWRTSGDHAGIRTAIERAAGANVLVIASAGNRGVSTDRAPQFPAAYPEVVAVAALDQLDRKAGLSNFGSTVDVSAPGINIRSTMPGGAYGFMDGTSMAAPHVAGVAALVWSRNLDLTSHQVREIVESTCDDLNATNPGFAGMLGRGRVNALNAVTSPDVFPD